MTRTTTDINGFNALGNVATPHNKLDGRLRVVHYSSVAGAGAAANINSSVADMAQWLRLQLARGSYNGKQIFTAKQSREMWTPHTIIPISEQFEKLNLQTNFRAYGLGWSLSDYHGRKAVGHGGALDGMLSQVGMIPSERLGIVVLTNSETPLAAILVNRIFDIFLGVTPRDWSGEALARAKTNEANEKLEAQKIEAARIPNTKPSLALGSYAGRYTGALYGDATVANENSKLIVRLAPSPPFIGDLEHWHYDTFRIRWRPSVAYAFGAGFVTFVIDEKGKPAEMKIDVPNPDFDFKELEFKRKG
jgi:CubicO group peptidase (beta-lactamase class C family)